MGKISAFEKRLQSAASDIVLESERSTTADLRPPPNCGKAVFGFSTPTVLVSSCLDSEAYSSCS